MHVAHELCKNNTTSQGPDLAPTIFNPYNKAEFLRRTRLSKIFGDIEPVALRRKSEIE